MSPIKILFYIFISTTWITIIQATCNDGPKSTAADPPYPVISDRYIARTEEVQQASISNVHSIVYITEEIYDQTNNMIAIDFIAENKIMKYILDWNTQQMIAVRIEHLHTHEETRQCEAKPLEDGRIFFPPLLWEDANITIDHIVSPGLLMGALNWTEAVYMGVVKFRDINAYRWDWCQNDQLINMYDNEVRLQTYWSVPDWKIPSSNEKVKHSVPLGWEITMDVNGDDKTVVAHNIMYFMDNITRSDAFRIPEGVHCINMTSTQNFPDYSNDRMFSFSMEYSMSGDHFITWADGWYDFRKQLYRIDHDILDSYNNLQTTTEIFDFKDGLAFTQYKNKLQECQISWINDSRTDWSDITGVSHLWGDSPAAFFGSDLVNYTYFGKSMKRYLKTNGWRAVRTDWPLDSIQEEPRTLWDWQFTNTNVSFISDVGDIEFIERVVPVSLTVTAMQDFQTSSGMNVSKWSKYDYTMYDFNMDPYKKKSFVDFGVFDLYDCYSSNWRRHLMFQLDISSWPEVINDPLLKLASFKEYWQLLLAETGNVSYIRITRLSVSELEDNVWIDFVLLFRHPLIGEISHDLFESMTSGMKAMENIKDAINQGKLNYHSDDNNKDLPALKDSFTEVSDPTCPPSASSTTSNHSPGTGTTSPHTQSSDNGATTTNKGSTGQSTDNTYTGSTTTTTTTTSSAPTQTTTTTRPPHVYTGGDLAGVGVGMTMAGIAVGAGMTYLVQVRQVHVKFVTWIKAR